MNLSYWEIKSWFTNVDFTIVGSGIVGLSTALFLKEKHPKANILILEKGILPQGASTKNAGFACFGSLSEIIDDLKTHSEQGAYELVKKRWEGLHLLRENLGDKNIDFQQLGGYELFNDEIVLNDCLEKKEEINQLLKPIFKQDIFSFVANKFNFLKVSDKLAFNRFEGQIDTGKIMVALLQKAQSKGIKILNNCTVENYSEQKNSVKIKTNIGEFSTNKLLIATNGFANKLLHLKVKPARAQVLITKPIKNLSVSGTFHLDKGYFYFRNIDDRILLGGGRNLDFKAEETTEFAQTTLIQSKLEELLSTTILPNKVVEVEHRWSGIMGVGNQKKAIIEQLSNHVACGVRLGGMGIAIGFLVGKELAQLMD
ncbi:FAD-dependent oxidoreductase [Aureibaculum sp. 2210JD6-5]|uniref:NAD(P)/FAD-dependent oxidoreductase n=1 Tax=Aureibaculum sp. 2210JD6-5 TaxID=3103957 RepID=UPI002AAD2372|nr:FAD-dependent oxidoreductase [Aureibaculum sp. 2210JD6-5]MDY7395769.1 FAD-dependent oxidoreductase [Aureibaculum sp. 2210JD6-5]